MQSPTKLTHRAAALLNLLFCGGHTVGTLRGRAPSPEAAPVLEQMRLVHFDFNGADRTLHEVFLGHALMVGLYLAGSSLLAWSVSNVRREQWKTVAPLAWGLAAAQLLTATIAARYFFIGPAAISALAAGLLLTGNVRMLRAAAVQ